MRSRYAAYTLGLVDYLSHTWHSGTRPSRESLTETVPRKWLGLEVRRCAIEGERATVEFVARYKVAGQAFRMHETSRFVREQGRWYYVDGDVT